MATFGTNDTGKQQTTNGGESAQQQIEQVEQIEQTVERDTFISTDNQQMSPVTPQIVDKETPIVVFVGPAASGKSMVLVRLAKYLRKKNFEIEADRSFIATKEYEQHCAQFEQVLGTNRALPGTINSLLVDVCDENKKMVAKLLEAPGEDFFDPENIGKEIPEYLSKIIGSPNRKAFVIILDLDSGKQTTRLRNVAAVRQAYEDRLKGPNIFGNIRKGYDRVVFLYNKIDVPGYGNRHGCTAQGRTNALRDAKAHYPLLFQTYMQRMLGGFLTVELYKFLPFQTGVYHYHVDDNGKPYQTYDLADDSYAAELWKEITKKW